MSSKIQLLPLQNVEHDINDLDVNNKNNTTGALTQDSVPTTIQTVAEINRSEMQGVKLVLTDELLQYNLLKVPITPPELKTQFDMMVQQGDELYSHNTTFSFEQAALSYANALTLIGKDEVEQRCKEGATQVYLKYADCWWNVRHQHTYKTKCVYVRALTRWNLFGNLLVAIRLGILRSEEATPRSAASADAEFRFVIERAGNDTQQARSLFEQHGILPVWQRMSQSH